MTTTVSVDAHAGHAVEVTQIYLVNGESVNENANVIIVNAGEKMNFYIHSTMSLAVRELPLDPES